MSEWDFETEGDARKAAAHMRRAVFNAGQAEPGFEQLT
jgi:hypothetical protein